MLIILEGPDGAGKTTLANVLVAELRDRHPSAKVELFHRGPPTSHPLNEYEAPLFDYRPGTGHHVVCDRWHMGEVVYPKVLHRDTQLTPEAYRHIELFLIARGALLVHVNEPTDTIQERLLSRGDALITPDLVPEIQDHYEELCLKTWLRTCSTPWLSEIIIDAEDQERSCRPIRKYVTYVGWRYPRILFFGDVRNADRTVRSPAFMPYPATSGEYLLRALDGIEGPFGVANACDVDDPTGLWLALGGPPVVALGVKALRRLRELPVKVRAAEHPQYVRRFHHHDVEAYGQHLMYGVTPPWRKEKIRVPDAARLA